MDEIVKGIVGPYGAIFLIVGIAITGARRIWVWGYQLVEEREQNKVEKEEWKARAERWEGIALKALNVGEKVVSKDG